MLTYADLCCVCWFARLEEARRLLDETLALLPQCVEALVAKGHLLAGVHCGLYEPRSAMQVYRRALLLSYADLC